MCVWCTLIMMTSMECTQSLAWLEVNYWEKQQDRLTSSEQSVTEALDEYARARKPELKSSGDAEGLSLPCSFLLFRL